MKIKTLEQNAVDTESLELIKQSARDLDENQHCPKEVLQKAGEYGFMGILIPEKYGGAGLGYHEYVSVVDEISKIDPSIGLSIAAHNSLCTNHIYKFGNKNQGD